MLGSNQANCGYNVDEECKPPKGRASPNHDRILKHSAHHGSKQITPRKEREARRAEQKVGHIQRALLSEFFNTHHCFHSHYHGQSPRPACISRVHGSIVLGCKQEAA